MNYFMSSTGQLEFNATCVDILPNIISLCIPLPRDPITTKSILYCLIIVRRVSAIELEVTTADSYDVRMFILFAL